MDYYELLEISRDAPREDVERAYVLQRETYDVDALAVYSLFDEAETVALRERIEEAYAVLSDAPRREAYDMTLRDSAATAGDASAAATPPPVARGDAGFGEAPATPPAGIVGSFDDLAEEEADTPWDGARLRRARLARSVELETIAAATKINTANLRSLEEDNFDDLPAPVYVRGFVQSYAKLLGLDAARVSRSYLERYTQHNRRKRRFRFLERR